MARGAFVAVLLALALVTAGCSGDELSSGDATAPTSAPTAVADPTQPPWSATALPQRPVAESNTAQSAEEFAAFVADVAVYVMATGDASVFPQIADMASCARCQGWHDNYTDGKIEKLSIVSAPVAHRLVEPPTVTDDVFAKVKLTLDVPSGEAVRKDDGEQLYQLEASQVPFEADLQWKDDRWLLMRYQWGAGQ